jgi:hypothetical protein
MADIQRALTNKRKVEDNSSLLAEYRDFEKTLFSVKEAEKLPLLRGLRIDYSIELED